MNKIGKQELLNERDWARLLSEIKKGNVVPIIGNELLKVNINGTETLLWKYLVKKLAERIGIDYKQGMDFTHFTCKKCMAQWDEIKTDPYYEISEILRTTRIEVPEALKKLFSIEEFKLILSTTFDYLAEKALKEIHGENNVKSLFYEKRTCGQDIEKANENQTIIYQMFGKLDVLPNSYVLTEDDLLEFLHFWMNDNYAPKKLLNILREKYLLVIGCNYPNWAFRFFLHSIKSSTQSSTEKRMGIIADSNLDNELVTFLSRVDAQIHDDAIVFIDELVSRYNKVSEPEIKKQVFISYASEDEAQARKVVDWFRKNNIGVWFDKKNLEAGDEYEKRIKDNIKDCELFVPILSKNVLDKGSRFFKSEWSWADDQLRQRFPKNFIYPIAIDDVDIQHQDIPEYYSKLQKTDFFSEDSENGMKQILRAIRRKK